MPDDALEPDQPKPPVVVLQPQKPIPWYKAPRIRQGLLAYIPGFVTLARVLFQLHLVKFDVSVVSTDDVIDILLLVLAIVGSIVAGTLVILHRIKDGLNPHHSSPPIATPKTIAVTETVVKRMTGSVPKP